LVHTDDSTSSFRRIKGKSRKFSGCADAAVAAVGKTSEFVFFETGVEFREGLDGCKKTMVMSRNFGI
jgi:hypothetical protein